MDLRGKVRTPHCSHPHIGTGFCEEYLDSGERIGQYRCASTPLHRVLRGTSTPVLSSEVYLQRLS